MAFFNIDLNDGKPPVSFSLKSDDSERFMDFMAECQALREAAQPASGWFERVFLPKGEYRTNALGNLERIPKSDAALKNLSDLTGEIGQEL